MRLERGDFERAIAAYLLKRVNVPAEVLAAGRASLDATGLFLATLPSCPRSTTTGGSSTSSSSSPAKPDEREDAMARRLLGERRPECPTIAVLGAYHALLEPVDAVEPAGGRVRRELPELDGVRVLFDAGEVWFHGRRAVGARSSWPGRELRLPRASPAHVEWHRHM